MEEKSQSFVSNVDFPLQPLARRGKNPEQYCTAGEDELNDLGALLLIVGGTN